MDDKQQIERLEQELRFLKESFEAEVISKEEYEKGKDRIEKKLKELESSESVIKKQEAQEPEKKEEIKPGEEKIRLKVINENESYDAKPVEVPKKEEPEIKKEYNKAFKYAVVFVVLTLVVFFSYSLLKPTNKEFQFQQKNEFMTNITEIIVQPEKIMPTNVVVLNGRDECFNCDTQRVLSILESWFGLLNVKEIDYRTQEGKNLIEEINAEVFPVYILDENIKGKTAFEKLKQTFTKKDNSYVLNYNAAAPAFYFKRENIPNRLDLFVIENDASSVKAESNLKEFLDNFKNIKFDKHFSDDQLAKELEIKTFPTFLVNNRVKFAGIQSAETIKNNFCSLNRLEECKKTLSKNLV